MKILSGTSTSAQISAGPLYFYHRPTPPIPKQSSRTPQEELSRFSRAQKRAVLDLAALYDQAFVQVGKEAASIFAIHAMLLEDPDFLDCIRTQIQKRDVTAEWAVAQVGRELADTFSGLSDPYMKARAMDIRDIARRVIAPLMHIPDRIVLARPSILVSDQLLPGEVMALNRSVLAVVSQKGSLDSHSSILLRAYRVPSIIGIEMDPAWDGHPALIDGHAGRLYLDPEQGVLDDLRRTYQAGTASSAH